MTRGSERFGRRQRLNTAADYQRVFEAPQRSVDGCFVVLARDNGGLPARLGLALARSKISAAVTRNRVKRIIRESFRRHQQQLTGRDFVVLARTDLSHIANHVLFESLAKHWARHAERRHD